MDFRVHHALLLQDASIKCLEGSVLGYQHRPFTGSIQYMPSAQHVLLLPCSVKSTLFAGVSCVQGGGGDGDEAAGSEGDDDEEDDEDEDDDKEGNETGE